MPRLAIRAVAGLAWGFARGLACGLAGLLALGAAAQAESTLATVKARSQLQCGINGQLLGLDEDWAYKAIKQVGSYSEIYERNVGKGAVLKFARGVNALWSRGGVMFPLPMQ